MTMSTFEENLVSETNGWVAAGLISADQREAILARYPGSTGGASANRFLGILAAVGGALFTVGVSLVIKSNWALIADWVKIGGLVALLAGVHALGWRLKLSPGHYPKLGDACLMVGALLFLLGIALVSQIFHIDSRPANGVLLWWVGISALPWITRAKGAQFVSMVAGVVWLNMELTSQDSWLRLVDKEQRWNEDSFFLLAAIGFVLGAGLTLLGRGLRGGARKDFSGLHEKMGLNLMCWALYALGFTWSAHNSSSHALTAIRWQPSVVVFVGVVVTAVWARARSPLDEKRLVWLIAPGLIPVVARLLGIDFAFFDTAWLWGGLACLAMFLLNIGMIRVGMVEGREGWINLGIAGIALNIVTRYFLLFGTMLEGGVFFIVTGVLVLGVGYGLEKKRRTFVSVVRKEAAR